MISLRGRRRLGAVVWALGVGVAVVWGSMTPSPPVGMPGMGYAKSVRISATESGRLAELPVSLHDTVERGAVVARLDPRPVQELREVVAAEFLESANVGDAPAPAQTDRIRRQAATLQLRAELAMVERQLASLTDLVQQGAATAAEVDQVALKRKAVAKKLAKAEGKQAGKAEEPPSSWSVVAALKRLDAIDGRLDRLQLRSTLDGKVAAVFHHEGEVVKRGDPILEVRTARTHRVIAYITASSKLPGRGDELQVVTGAKQKLTGVVRSVGPGATELPESLWTIPRRPQLGTAVIIELKDATVAPNEAVTVVSKQ